MIDEKKQVYHFWNNATCGEALYLKNETKEAYVAHAHQRYELEPMIQSFAAFDLYHDKHVLEIGVGLGADHQRFAEAGSNLQGIDLTERAVLHTKNRLELLGLKSVLQVSDAENLPFVANSFDLVYSWGVLHHSPNTVQAIAEVYRVLKKGGEAKVMIYHKYSLVGYMLWLRYALLQWRPFTSLTAIYAQYLESPGTKAYSIREANALFHSFEHVNIKTVLTHGDLLTSSAGQRHQGMVLKMARLFWPRWFFKLFFKRHGLFMLIQAKK